MRGVASVLALVAGCVPGSSDRAALGAVCQSGDVCDGDVCVKVCSKPCELGVADECPTDWLCKKESLFTNDTSCYPTISVATVTGSVGEPITIVAARSALLESTTQVHWYLPGIPDEITQSAQIVRTFTEAATYELSVTLLVGEQKLADGAGMVVVQ